MTAAMACITGRTEPRGAVEGVRKTVWLPARAGRVPTVSRKVLRMSNVRLLLRRRGEA